MRCKFSVAKFYQIVSRTRESQSARREKADAGRVSSSAFQVLRHSSSLKSRCLPTFEFIKKLLCRYKLSHWLLCLVHLTSDTVMLLLLLLLSRFSRVRLSVTPWTVAPQAPLSRDFTGKNTGEGCHSYSRGSSRPRGWTRISCRLLPWQVDSLLLSHLGSPSSCCCCCCC